MKIGIIGGAGFIGCNLAEHYLAGGAGVVIFDNFSRKGTELNLKWLKSVAGGRLTVVKGDIRRDNKKLESFVSGCGTVFHLAAQVAVTTSVTDPRDDFETNALGTFNVLEAVRKSRNRPPLLYASTNKVYGKMDDLKVAEKKGRYVYKSLPGGVSEAKCLDFYSPYGCSKGCGDQYVRDYSRIYGLKTVVFRQSCIYGERQFGIEDQGWIAWFTIAATLGKKVTIYGDGKQVRDVLHVKDLINAYTSALAHLDKTAGRTFNVGGGPAFTLSLKELLVILEKLLGRKVPRGHSDWRPGDQRVFVSDISAARKAFGWKPRISPAAGIEQLYAWVRANKSEISACLGK